MFMPSLLEGLKAFLCTSPKLFEEIPAGISVPQRIIHYVGVTVVALQITRRLDVRVSTQEPSNRRIINAAVHVYGTVLRAHFTQPAIA